MTNPFYTTVRLAAKLAIFPLLLVVWLIFLPCIALIELCENSRFYDFTREMRIWFSLIPDFFRR